MKIILKNIGKIYDEVQIYLNGITVIAGVNGAGKSTIGKSLYCLYNTFYDIDGQLAKERKKSIEKILVSNFKYLKSRDRQVVSHLADEIDEIYINSGDIGQIKQYLISRFNIKDEYVDLFKTIDRLSSIYNISYTDILPKMLKYRLEAEFGDNIANIENKHDYSKIAIEDGNKEYSVIIDNKRIQISTEIDIGKELIYIDDLAIAKAMTNKLKASLTSDVYSHINDLCEKLGRNYIENMSAFDQLIYEQKLDEIVDKIEQIGIGDLVDSNDDSYIYQDLDKKETFSIQSISEGLKSFAVIKKLIRNGSLTENSILLLDEPESHLHPEWQKVYAEMIVLLQSQLDIKILISTHSTDFLSFIELYANKYKQKENCHYYLLEDTSDKYVSQIREVTDNVDEIYRQLGTPFLKASEEINSAYED